MATEVATFKLHDGKIPDDSSSPAGQVLKDTLDTLTGQPGFQRLYWGREQENANIFRLFVDWDSVDTHKKFIATGDDLYNPFLQKFGQIAELDTATIFHAHFTPHPASEALSDHVSPTTEILTVYFPQDYSTQDQEKFESDLKQFVAVIEKEAKTYTASGGGWAEEDVDIPGTSEKGKAFIAAIGWKSMEDHMLFRETNAFKDNVHYLRDAKNLKKFTVSHASLTQIDSGPVGDYGANSAGVDAQEEVLNPLAGQERNPPKTRSDGTTTKNSTEDHPYTTNAVKKERQGR